MTNIFSLENFQTGKLPKKFYQGLTALLHDLGIDGNNIVDDFIAQYIHYAHQKTSTKSSVYLSTGFSRHIVKKYLDANNLYKKHKKRSFYYGLLLAELQKLSSQYHDGLIPIYGEFGSFTATFDNTKQPGNIITSKSMLNQLITIGVVEKVENKIRFLTSLQSRGLFTADAIIDLLASLMHQLSQTLLHNFNAKSADDTLYQMSYLSNSIRPDKRQELTDKLRELARQHFREYQQLIDSYEETDISIQEIENLNNELGISTFIFNNDTEV